MNFQRKLANKTERTHSTVRGKATPEITNITIDINVQLFIQQDQHQFMSYRHSNKTESFHFSH